MGENGYETTHGVEGTIRDSASPVLLEDGRPIEERLEEALRNFQETSSLLIVRFDAAVTQAEVVFTKIEKEGIAGILKGMLGKKKGG